MKTKIERYNPLGAGEALRKWARPAWFEETYGISRGILLRAALAGKVRRIRFGDARGAASILNVADVDAWLAECAAKFGKGKGRDATA